MSQAKLRLTISANGGKPLVPFARSGVGATELNRIHPELLSAQTLLRATCILLLLATDRGKGGIANGQLPFRCHAKKRTWIDTLANANSSALEEFFTCFGIGQFWTATRRGRRSPSRVSLDTTILPLDNLKLLTTSPKHPGGRPLTDLKKLRVLAGLLERQFMFGKKFEGKKLEGKQGWKKKIVPDILRQAAEEKDQEEALTQESAIETFPPWKNTRPREQWSLAEMVVELFNQIQKPGSEKLCIALFEDMSRIRTNICNEYLCEDFDFPLLFAISFQREQLFHYLLERKVEVNRISRWYGFTPLLKAARTNYSGFIEPILSVADKNAPKARSFMGVNAIHEVVFGATKHAMEIITQFTKLGADCNARTYEGLLPLSIAISRQCRRDVISHLSELAVDAGIINVRDKYGETLVYKAFRNGDFHTMTELAKMMPKNDAWMRPPHVLPQDRGSELFQACHNGSHERASRILLQKPDINAREEIFGRTALHEAVERSRGAFVDLLLSNGAHPFLQDRHGKFPRDLLPAAGRADDPLVAAYLRAGEEQWIVKEFTGASIDRIAEWIEGNGSATQDRTALSLKRSFEKCCPT